VIDLRVVVPAAVAWVVAIVILPNPGAILPVAICAWICAAICIGLARFAHRPVFVVLAVAASAVALVATAAFAHADARRPAFLSHSSHIESAQIVANQTITRSTRHFGATLIRVGDRTLSVPVMVFDGSPKHRVEIGSTLRVSGSMTATAPGDEVSFLVFAGGPATLLQHPPWYLAWANGLRSEFAWASTAMPGDGGALLPGLAIGDTVAVSPSLSDAMKAASLTHLTAVSGANCALLIGLVMLVGKAAGMRRGVRVAIALAILLGFVVLVTPQPSVLRAGVMSTLVLIALARGRPIGGLPVIGVAVLVLLTIDPWLAINYGFALSVLATAGLMLLSAPIAGVLRRWLPGWLALLIAVPVAAQVACQPVLILLTPSLPLYGVLANMLAEPASPAATVLGLLACILLPVLPPVGHVLTAVAWLPAAWIAAVARFCAGLPGAKLPWLDGLLGAALLVVITALLLALVLGRLSPRWRRLVALALASTLVCMVAITGVSRIVQQLGRPADWQIADCNIGQGDAMIVRSAGKVALMDAGPSEPLLSACLDTLGITHLDLLVLSHYDLDHVAGTPAVDGMVDRVIVGPSSGQARDAELIRGLLDGGARVDRVSEGLTGVLGDLKWSVLWPPARLPDDIQPGNEACVTVLFEPIGQCPGGCLSSMFVGDLDENAQNQLLAANPRLPRLDVIEVAHHGSADQSAELYKRVDAAVGVIGVGRDNRYGHPTRHLLDILASVGTLPARTDTEGLVLLAPGDRAGTVTVWSEHPDTGGAG
jgi:competence protein ComEC